MLTKAGPAKVKFHKPLIANDMLRALIKKTRTGSQVWILNRRIVCPKKIGPRSFRGWEATSQKIATRRSRTPNRIVVVLRLRPWLRRTGRALTSSEPETPKQNGAVSWQSASFPRLTIVKRAFSPVIRGICGRGRPHYNIALYCGYAHQTGLCASIPTSTGG
jgi:hypothetical protein